MMTNLYFKINQNLIGIINQMELLILTIYPIVQDEKENEKLAKTMQKWNIKIQKLKNIIRTKLIYKLLIQNIKSGK